MSESIARHPEVGNQKTKANGGPPTAIGFCFASHDDHGYSITAFLNTVLVGGNPPCYWKDSSPVLVQLVS